MARASKRMRVTSKNALRLSRVPQLRVGDLTVRPATQASEALAHSLYIATEGCDCARPQ